MKRETYILYYRLSERVQGGVVKLAQVAKEHGLSVLRERTSQVTVEASDEEINFLRSKFPTIEATKQKIYHRTM